MFDREWDEPKHAHAVGELLLVVYDGKPTFAMCTKLLDDFSHEFTVLDVNSDDLHMQFFTLSEHTFVGKRRVGFHLYMLHQSEVDTLHSTGTLAQPTIYMNVPITVLMELEEQRK